MFFGALPLIFATLIVAGAGVEVRGVANCPSPEDISAQLKPLLPVVAGASGERDVALIDLIETRPDGTTDLMIRLLRPDTSEIGNRRVSLGGTCQDMAEAVVAILAAWETDPAGDSTPNDESLPAPAKDQPKIEAAIASLPPQRASGWNVLVGAGAGAALVGGVAACGIVETIVGQDDSHWQGRVGVATQTARTLTLSSGHADWQHTSFAVGLLWRSLGSAWRFSGDAGPVLGWSTWSGSGFSPNRQQRIFEYGATAGLRLGRTWGRWTLWAETRAHWWVQNVQPTATAPVSGPAVDSKDVPPADATVGLGLSLALFP